MSRYSEPVSSLGRRVRGFIDSSDEESGSHSEDDYEIIGLPNVGGIKYVLLVMTPNSDGH
jgi:hypothetical protein